MEELLEKVVGGMNKRLQIARVEFWLIENGDICSRCEQRTRCPDQPHCLHLVAARNSPLSGSGQQISHSNNSNERIPLSAGIIGRIAATGQDVELINLDKSPGELGGLERLPPKQVRVFAESAIPFQGETMGVFAILSRINANPKGGTWRQFFADHIGAAISNTRAFEEIQKSKAESKQQNAYLMEEVMETKAFGKLVGQCAALQQIPSQIDLVAPTETSVLILGECGTGKELIAHEIHHRSARRVGPSVRVNCASIPRDLPESELFESLRFLD
jgi:transcriptional regulator with GAF, ATPase, and Fis domain